jgi:uncharacterized protein (DUF427 family)
MLRRRNGRKLEASDFTTTADFKGGAAYRRTTVANAEKWKIARDHG